MALWTIVPIEDIYFQEYVPQYEEIDYDGTKVLMEKTEDGRYRVSRVLSSNPVDFLRSEIQPGCFLEMNDISNE